MEGWEKQDVIVLWIWVGIGIFVLFTLFISVLVIRQISVLKQTKKKAKKRLKESEDVFYEKTISFQENERQRLAEELHDNIISQLNRVRLSLTQGNIEKLNLDLQHSMRAIRELSHNLTPPELSQISLSNLIEDYLEPIQKSITIDYWHNWLEEGYPLRDALKLDLFRIFQELVNNTIKHAQAKKLEVNLRLSSRCIVLMVRDDGKGMTASGKDTGIGMRNIAVRAKRLNARYKFKSKPNGGTFFIILVTELTQNSS